MLCAGGGQVALRGFQRRWAWRGFDVWLLAYPFVCFVTVYPKGARPGALVMLSSRPNAELYALLDRVDRLAGFLAIFLYSHPNHTSPLLFVWHG